MTNKRDVHLVVRHPRYGRVEYVPVEKSGPNPLMALRGGGTARRNDIVADAVHRGWDAELIPGRAE